MKPTDKVNVIINGMTRKQALTFAAWYEGQGEQSQSVWFDINNVEAPITDVSRKGGFMKEGPETVVIYVK